MKIVGQKLEGWAAASKDGAITDIFGRSAFNRYYYASFLITREMLGELAPKWKHTPHGEIPNLLKTAIRKPVHHALKNASHKGLIELSKSSKLKTAYDKNTEELADLLIKAYEARIISDYEPETPILVEGNVLSINNIRLNSASNWPDQASAYTKRIRKIWKEAHGT